MLSHNNEIDSGDWKAVCTNDTKSAALKSMHKDWNAIYGSRLKNYSNRIQ